MWHLASQGGRTRGTPRWHYTWHLSLSWQPYFSLALLRVVIISCGSYLGYVVHCTYVSFGFASLLMLTQLLFSFRLKVCYFLIISAGFRLLLVLDKPFVIVDSAFVLVLAYVLLFFNYFRWVQALKDVFELLTLAPDIRRVIQVSPSMRLFSLADTVVFVLVSWFKSSLPSFVFRILSSCVNIWLKNVLILEEISSWQY